MTFRIARRGPVMQMPAAQGMQAELEQLFRKQAETLNASLTDLSTEELLEYEQRYERIRELCAKLLTANGLAA